jgi:MoaA/NifB/PqqE/SkfB family radical SAM enzyme
MKGFCLYPFNRVHLSVGGDVYVCCAAWLKMPIGNIFKNDFHDIWNSEKAGEIRESIFDGSFRFCKKDTCPRIITKQIENESIPAKFAPIIKKRETYLNSGPEHISLNYDYSCNLYCPSCRKRRMVMGREEGEQLIKFQNSLLDSNLFRGARRLVVTGSGEPFAGHVYMDLFGKIDRRKHSGLKITLRTNGLLLTPENWGKIKPLHYAIDNISISIDAATEKTYGLLRRGGDFKTLLKNLKFLQGIKKEYGFKLGMNFVVQEQNFKEMPEFVKLAEKYRGDEVVFTQLMDRKTYSTGEYSSLAVHKPGHPRYESLREIMKNRVFRNPIVSFNNISNLIEDD